MQTPAEGILVRKDLGDFKSYLVVCDCGDTDHSHEVVVEATDNSVDVNVYVQVDVKQSLVDRLSAIWSLITTGQCKTEVSLVLSEQQALNYAATLQQAVASVAEHKRKNSNT